MNVPELDCEILEMPFEWPKIVACGENDRDFDVTELWLIRRCRRRCADCVNRVFFLIRWNVRSAVVEEE